MSLRTPFPSIFIAASVLVAGGAQAQEWLSPRPMTPAQTQQKPAPQPQKPAPQVTSQAQQPAPQPVIQPQQSGPELIQAFGDWRISCVSKPGRACQITQRQVNTANRQMTLMVELTLASQPKPRNILSVVTPLGVKLGPSLSIRGNGGEVSAVPLVTCVTTGCIHSGDLAAKQVEGFRKAKDLNTQVTPVNGAPATLAISTKGLEEAFQRVSAYLKGS